MLMQKIVQLQLLSTFLLTAICFMACNTQTANKEKKEIVKKATNTTTKKTIPQNTVGEEEFDEFAFMQEESLGDIHLGLAAAKLSQLLGTPTTKTKPVEWGADASYHHTLTYKKQGIELDMVEEMDKSIVVNMITITAPSQLKTKRGIGIGSSSRAVHTVYKKEISSDFSDEETIVAGSIYGGVIFGIKNHQVSSIFIGAAAE